MRKAVLILGLAAAGGCDGLLPGSDVAAVVWVVNERNAPLRPDEVVWYYDTQSERYDGEHPAVCINAGCSRWGVPREATGTVYVVASWRRPRGSTDCFFSGYDASPLTASADDPPTVVLKLNTKQESCA